ncbi:MAG: hypothetical protein ACI828_001494 [Flavobacteriales bacterium]|jgi:hypothetical protein
MIRNLVKVTVLPFMIGLLALGNFSEEKKELDFSEYATEGLDLFYTVPTQEEIAPLFMVPMTVPFPYAGNLFVGFKEALAFKESQGNYFVVNRLGYMGKYQFGRTTLELLGIRNKQTFLKDPLMQEKAFILNASRNKWVLRKDITRFRGRWIGGVKVTESGILAAAHLAGPGGVKKFLRSGGTVGFNDAFGTSIRSYMKRFSGYDVSFVQPNRHPKFKK